MSIGYFTVTRKLNQLFQPEKPYSRNEALIWIISNIPWGDSGKLKKGVLQTSYKELSRQFGRSSSWVFKLIQDLRENEEYTIKSNRFEGLIVECARERERERDQNEIQELNPIVNEGQRTRSERDREQALYIRNKIEDINYGSSTSKSDTPKRVKKTPEISQPTALPTKGVSTPQTPAKKTPSPLPENLKPIFPRDDPDSKVRLSDSEIEKLLTLWFCDGELFRINFWADQLNGYALREPKLFAGYSDHYRTIRNWDSRELKKGLTWSALPQPGFYPIWAIENRAKSQNAGSG